MSPDPNRKRDRYDDYATFDLIRRLATFHRNPDLAIHRTVVPPPSWIRANPATPKSYALYDRIAELANLKPGGRVLDVGCGFGAALLRLYQTHRIIGVGVTPSVKQAHTARAYLASAGAEPACSICIGSFEDASVEGDFDLILMVESLVHAQNTLHAVDSCVSRLGRNGRIVIVDDIWHSVDKTLPKWFEDIWPSPSVLTSESLLAALAECAMRIDHTEDLTRSVKLVDPWVRSVVRPLLSFRLPSEGTRLGEIREFYRAQMYLQQAYYDQQLSYLVTVSSKQI